MAAATNRQTVPFQQQVFWAAALAVLVVVVHSGHLLADDARHAGLPPGQMAAHAVGTPSVESSPQLRDHAEADACMILELCAPRGVLLTFVGIATYALAPLVILPGVVHVSAAEWTARAPPGPRRQALLGVFRS